MQIQTDPFTAWADQKWATQLAHFVLWNVYDCSSVVYPDPHVSRTFPWIQIRIQQKMALEINIKKL